MKLFGRKQPAGVERQCVFVVRCVHDVPPPTESAEPWQVSVRPAAPTEPPPTDDPEILRRWRGAASEALFVLGPSGHDAGPLITIGMELADALADTAEGVIADPVAQRILLPGTWRSAEKVYDVDPREHVTVHVVEDGDGLWVHTHGLLKFGRAELELYGIPRAQQQAAWAFVLDIAGYTIDGPQIAAGHTLGAPAAPLRAHEGTREREHWESTPVLELRGEGVSTADAIASWAA